MEYNVHTLPNGIRILHVPSASAISHACIIINSGSRDENDENAGLAHFIEHLIFKRTEKRSTNQILNRLESVGADLNAYTTKEYTCIHASFLNPYLDRTLELFNDIVFHSTFPEDEMDKEKSVILDEIASYLDQPEEAIYDDFEDLVFSGHALGRNILGTTESVSKITQKDIHQFIKENYHTDKMVIAVLGNYSLNKVVKVGAKHYSEIPANLHTSTRETPLKAPVVTKTFNKPIQQAHAMLGSQAYSLHHPYKTGLLLLNNLLGGNGMSSILNLQIREKYGIAYTIESGYSPLSDTGIFTLYFGTDKEKVNKASALIFKELKKLRDNHFSEVQLQKAKNKFIGQIALGEENRIGLIISMAKSLIDYDKIDDLETVFSKIQAVSTTDIGNITNEILDESNLSALTFYPLG
ncbi:insulinase family protein [Pedobacter panaciterrae]|jgi:predicted Zn-dependent peptidase|uniref:M16 family metallopeptidase n=1 Tax=Pedobacter panaciterrae TaxID=363849 RepID=UPI00155D98DB|nr:pitrilysin family protein [Pedobacter panaciterrae]NQX55630.1 insulinase family protein [Pedobacter panaciterrae]